MSTSVVLYSTNRDLHQQIETILGDMPGPTPSLRRMDVESVGEDADLYIWDYHTGMQVPTDFVGRNPRSHLFVLNRRSLPVFRQAVPVPDVMTYFRPVANASLQACLLQAIVGRSSQSLGANGEMLALRSDRDEILDCLLRTNEKLQEYDRERTNFLARAVHDFRAPLTAIAGYSALLLGGQLGPVNGEQREALERMRRCAVRLAKMANGMMELSLGSRSQAGASTLRCEVRDCIEQAVSEVLPLSVEKNITISADVPSQPVILPIDGSQLEQVLVNLLDNALKFTPKRGDIQIRAYPYFWERRSADDEQWRVKDRRKGVQRQSNALRVDIQDSGPGIPRNQLDSIFDEYTSYSGSQDRSGGGLGLAICRLIVSQHHGRVWAENSDTRGAVFSFVLPVIAGEHRN